MKVTITCEAWQVEVYRDGELLETYKTESLKKAEQVANIFEQKYGEYSTSIRTIFNQSQQNHTVPDRS